MEIHIRSLILQMIKIANLLKQKDEQYGIRWSEFDRNDRPIKKEKIFNTQKQRDTFVKKLQKKPNFYQFEAWFN